MRMCYILQKPVSFPYGHRINKITLYIKFYNGKGKVNKPVLCFLFPLKINQSKLLALKGTNVSVPLQLQRDKSMSMVVTKGKTQQYHTNACMNPYQVKARCPKAPSTIWQQHHIMNKGDIHCRDDSSSIDLIRMKKLLNFAQLLLKFSLH